LLTLRVVQKHLIYWKVAWMNNVNEQNLQGWFRSQSQSRLGRDYINESFVANKTALVVVDMQNYFMKPGFLAACPMAIDIVSTINIMANNLRDKLECL
jgi:ureidoacrylate peracid hydrolase